MGFAGDVFADLVEMQLHRFGIGPRQHESGACPSFWTDGAKQVGVLVALVGRLARACALLCPQTGPSVLLTDACVRAGNDSLDQFLFALTPGTILRQACS